MSKQKLKTHRGTLKRIKRSAKGELLRRRANGTHLMEKKGPARKRVISTSASVRGSIRKKLKRALGV